MKPVTTFSSWMTEFPNDPDCIDTDRSDYFCTRSELIRMVALCGGLTLLVFTACFINTYSAPITCNAGTYVVGQPASITCNFRTNISASQRSFNMARYPPNAEKGEIGTDILVCHWSVANHKHDCTVTNGYVFDKVITDQVIVTIPDTDESFEGLYMCFFVPSQGKDAHACDFDIAIESMDSKKAANDTHTDPPSGGDHTSNTSHTTWIAAVCVMVAITTILSLFWYTRRRHQKKNPERGLTEEKEVLIEPKNKKIKTRLEKFELSINTLKEMMDMLDQEMNKGLHDSTQAHVKMYPVYCPKPDTAGLGDYLMVDFGSTCVKVSNVQLRNKGVMISSDSYPFDPEMKNATGKEIFDFILSAISRFLKNQTKSAKQLKSVLVFHFPCHHKSIEKASIAKWTKEFNCEGVVDQDLNELLQKCIQKRTDLKLKVVAIVNSVVNTLMSAVFHNPRCMMGLVVGNGFNACYVDKSRKEETDGAKDKGSYEIYNTELGALGENCSLDDFRTDYDNELDKSSRKPGSQILEKMVSWTYIGEIVRLGLEDLRKDELVFTDGSVIGGLAKKDGVTSNHVATIDKDMSENFGETADILRNLGVLNPTEEDLKTVKYICRLVTERAASLAAASLATLINRLGQPELVIVVDGELYRQIPHFQDVMYSQTQELVEPALRDKFYLVSSFRGGRTGAARMAAAALSKQNAAAADT